MKPTKFLTFAITVLSGSIVIFNSTIDIFNKIFTPQLNIKAFIFLGIIIFVSTTYLANNWRDFK